MGQSIKGKIAYITGASSGIGKATAIELAKQGVNIGLLARSEQKLKDVSERIQNLGVSSQYQVVDISDETQVDNAITQLEGLLGKADILINNAGISTYGNVDEVTSAEWKQIFHVNVFGTYHVTRRVLPHMKEKNQGDIIMISSSNGLKGTAGSTAYSGSKFAIQGMAEALMQEVRPNNIRVFTMNPSLVATELVFGNDLSEKNEDKFMQPEDLAEYIVSQLKLHPRIFIKQSLQWATNPF
ncbi:3-oxoacyl-[acyl-carrier-protein] reductase [Oceanobacillus iheyensis HTE831]|uniref:3-oxoacyl-[acyl-carrier-protein] reductase n=1 Tax=Oceanobacillus iheyensis (strain DSM 14371 / CIP 107618 / JCM 11309 / KCTC 3954 / HTE831) TaxID=221109 RepID=Q8EQ70_OCEIH|nr:3-ketoacyl-ACP reductase [Oceanobacillus iheyensis]BAC13799.1 3-oxoacyl-[acyl-carrier-protein] reductase [Oceanobacillus iheyensis HTE831]